MLNVWRNILLCLLAAAIFIMPISAVRNGEVIFPVDVTGMTLGGIPNDPYFYKQWHLKNTGENFVDEEWGHAIIPDCDIDADEAWEIETGSPDVIIAIIDSGVDYNHPDLADNIWTNDDEIPDNDIDDDNNGYVDDYYGYDFYNKDEFPLDDRGHGTICAGIVSAVTNNEVGISGVCWNCKIMCIKAWNHLISFREDYVTDAIKYAADNGADVISMSMGVDGMGMEHPTIFKDAIDYAYDKGAVIVSIVGNDGKSRAIYPAGYDNVIAVAGTDWNDSRMNYPEYGMISRYGNWIDVAAPSARIFSTMPTYEVHFNTYGLPLNYSFNWGTSYAGPHVAGIAALLLSQDPTLTNDEIKSIIRANVDPYTSEKYIGTGRINAYKALTRYNSQPEIPGTPTGEINGRTGRRYTFTTSSTDPDDDPLYYVWDWGDGNYSEALGPFESGETCEAEYAWGHDGNFSIQVKAMDMKGGESYWSDPAIVSMPKNRIININPLIIQFLESHPHLFPMLRFLLGLN